MRNLLLAAAIALLAAIFLAPIAHALSVATVPQGGTGSSTLTGILIGNATSPVKTLTIGTNLTLTGTTLSASGGGSAFPFTPAAWGNATGTVIGFGAGIFSNASSTFTILQSASSTLTGKTVLQNATTSFLGLTGVGGSKVLATDPNGTIIATTTLYSLDALTAPVQTFSHSDDTNIALSWSTSGTANHVLTVSWSGTLADNRIASAATWNAKENALTFNYPLTRATNSISLAFGTTTSNTWAGTQTFSNASIFSAGLVSNGSTTISGLTSGLTGNNNGLLYGFASSSLFGYTPLNPTRALTVAGTANQITCAGGTQDLSADRTWTCSYPNHVIFPVDYEAASGTTTNATSTNLYNVGSSTIAGAFNSPFSNMLGSTTLSGSALFSNATGTNMFLNGSSTIKGAFNSSLANILASSTLSGSTLFTNATGTTQYLTGSSTVVGAFNSLLANWFASTTLSGSTLFANATGTTLYLTGSTTHVGTLNSTFANWFASSTLGGSTLFTNATGTALTLTGSTTIGGAFNAISNTQLGSTTLWGSSLFVSATTTNLGLTSFKGCSGANALTTTAAGSVICGAISATANAGGTNGQIQYNDGGSTLNGASPSTFSKTGGWFSFGTSTLTLSGGSPALGIFGSSTKAQILLTDNSLTSDNIFMREINGNFFVGTSSPASGYATTTSPLFAFMASSTLTGTLGVFTATPRAALDVNGLITSTETKVATSTSFTVDWANSANQVLVQMGAAGMTINFTNYGIGMTKRVVVCNPTGTAGALTWGTTILWPASTKPTQTTTASMCDIWSFIVTAGTSTNATAEIFGAQSANFP